MKLYLYRTRTRQLTTDGVLLSSTGIRVCDTAEHTPTMLPQGEYMVTLTRHPKYKHRAPCVLPSPSPSGEGWGEAFLIHGNGVYSKDFGSDIIVGDHLVPGVVINSQHYFLQIVKRIEKALKREKKVELIIK